MSSISEIPGAAKSSPAAINGFHVFLLLITSTQNALLWKMFASFSGFIDKDYHFSYTSLTTGLSIATLSTILALFINPRVTFLKTNVLIFLIQLLQIIGILLLWLVKHNIVIFVIGLSLLCNVFQLHWGATNGIMSTFVYDSIQRRKYLAIYNSNWTIGTFLFIVTGIIMRYYSYWMFLKIMLVSSICFAILNLLFLPKISIDQQNAFNIGLSPKSAAKQNSLWFDLKILFLNNKVYATLFSAVLLQFFVWGLMYVTFGPFMQQLFDLDAAAFGTIFALIEGLGNAIAIALLYVVKSTKMVVFGGIVEFISILLVMLMTNASGLEFLLQVKYQYLMYFIIFLFFVGNECIVVGIMILNVQIAPAKQQARASGLISFGNSLAAFVATLIAGPLYSDEGMNIQSIIVIIVVIVELIVIASFYAIYRSKEKREYLKINQYETQSYSSV